MNEWSKIERQRRENPNASGTRFWFAYYLSAWNTHTRIVSESENESQSTSSIHEHIIWMIVLFVLLPSFFFHFCDIHFISSHALILTHTFRIEFAISIHLVTLCVSAAFFHTGFFVFIYIFCCLHTSIKLFLCVDCDCVYNIIRWIRILLHTEYD